MIDSGAAMDPSLAHLFDLDIRPLCSADAAARADLLRELHRACAGAGFFGIASPPIPDDLMRRAYQQSAAFHGLADQSPIKRSVHKSRSPARRGFSAAGEEPAYEAGTRSLCASFDMSREDPATGACVHGPNLWPDEAALPHFRHTICSYYLALENLGRVLSGAFAEMLGLAPDTFARHATERAFSELRLLFYPAHPGPADERLLGISAHTDFECFTLMTQSAPGLQLMHRDGRWIDAPCREDGLIVIMGDMLERWTNGHIQATRHRVKTTPWERYSLILFCAVDPDIEVAPLPAFVSAEHPPRYQPTTQAAHIQARMTSALANRHERP